MNIKQAESLTGVSRQNIRFYEREGLLDPDRNPDNDYREYTDAHIRILKQIRILRMLDMPLEKIRMVLRGALSLSQAVQEQEIHLKQRQAELLTAIRFCGELKTAGSLSEINEDEVLRKMNQPENSDGFFRQWLSDYRKVVLSEHQKYFTFVPEQPVNTPAEFTDALFAYANAHNLYLVVTKESMYPCFTIDGIEYEAHRIYTNMVRVPMTVVRCRVRYPEDFEPDVPLKRKRYMKILNLGWLGALFLLLNLSWFLRAISMNEPIWTIVLQILAVCALTFGGLYRIWLFHFNEKH